jgi:hypothetical protein
MSRSQTTSTLAQTDFYVVEGPEIESGGWNICPTIDPTSLLGPGRGWTYIYEADVAPDELRAGENASFLRFGARGCGLGELLTGLQATPAERFQKLAATWKAAVRFLSDTDEMCSHPAYQEIIGMGAAALPFIFLELEREPDNWFWALKAITGEDPVPEEHRGNVELMAKDWLLWAQSCRAALSFDLQKVLAALGS